MRKLIIPAIALLCIASGSCNNAEKKADDHSSQAANVPKTQEDSLMADVMDGHDVGMGKMGKLSAMQKNVQQALDSIAKLPAKAKLAAEPLKAKLSGLLEELNSAKSGMEKWMDEFNYDSAKDNIEQRIKYLTGEKLKVSKVKEAMLGGLQKADSLLKAKL